MPYPPQYFPSFDLAQAQNSGDMPSATEIFAELSNIGNSVNQAIAFIKALSTSDQRFKPSQLFATVNVEQQQEEATAGQTDFLYQGGFTVDPSVATVEVYVDGALVDPTTVTIQSDRITLAAQAGGETVVWVLHDNADSVFVKLADISAGFGAALIGVEDALGQYASTDVENCLAEVRKVVDDFVIYVGDLSKYLRADSAVPWEVDQNADGYTITGMAPAVESTSPVILSQISDVLANLSDLESRFLALAGGVMQGAINMGGNRIVSVGDPVADRDAVNKQAMEAAITAEGETRLALEGTKKTVAEGTLIGPVTLNTDGTVTADADQTTDPSTVAIPTIHGVPLPAADDQVANKGYVDQAVAGAPAGGFPYVATFWGNGNADVTHGSLVHNGSGNYTWTLPANIATSMRIKAVGGGGGGAGSGGGSTGSPSWAGVNGVSSTVAINAGPTLTVAAAGSGAPGGTGTVGGAGGSGGDATAKVNGETGGVTTGFNGASGRGGNVMSMNSVARGGDSVAGSSGAGKKGLGFGAGGSGGATAQATSYSGAGGGSGQYGELDLTVAASDSLTVQCGTGGAGGAHVSYPGGAGAGGTFVDGGDGSEGGGGPNYVGGGGGAAGFVQIWYNLV